MRPKNRSWDSPGRQSGARSGPLTCGFIGADDGIRTRDPNLGKVVLYQLSHVRVSFHDTKPEKGVDPAYRQRRPVEPKPPSPRADELSSSTGSHSTASTLAITSWAMRSPRRT
jgi:hypothetical protein